MATFKDLYTYRDTQHTSSQGKRAIIPIPWWNAAVSKIDELAGSAGGSRINDSANTTFVDTAATAGNISMEAVSAVTCESPAISLLADSVDNPGVITIGSTNDPTDPRILVDTSSSYIRVLTGDISIGDPAGSSNSTYMRLDDSLSALNLQTTGYSVIGDGVGNTTKITTNVTGGVIQLQAADVNSRVTLNSGGISHSFEVLNNGFVTQRNTIGVANPIILLGDIANSSSTYTRISADDNEIFLHGGPNDTNFILDDANQTVTIGLGAVPTHADDAAAGTAGLTAGMIYKTATGQLMIKL